MVCTLRVQTQVKKKPHTCPHCAAPVLCRENLVQVILCFLEAKHKPTYLSLPASSACWCPVHAQDPSPHTIWAFTTLVACCSPQLPPLFLLNPAQVLHTDEYVLHLVLDEQSPEKAKAPQSPISVMSIPATSTVSSGAVLFF